MHFILVINPQFLSKNLRTTKILSKTIGIKLNFLFLNICNFIQIQILNIIF